MQILYRFFAVGERYGVGDIFVVPRGLKVSRTADIDAHPVIANLPLFTFLPFIGDFTSHSH